jgi:hypothetical protein
MKARRSPTVASGLAAVAVALLIQDATMAQGTYAYPLAGQSPEQQARDEDACRQWARQQTGVDPNRPPPRAQGYYAPPPPQQGFFGGGAVGEGGMVRDAAGGAALGAIGGAIAGDAGTGAAAGAAAGALFGTIRRSNRQYQEQQWQAQQQAEMQRQQQALNQQHQQGIASFNRAYAVCMKGRKYQVE